MAEQENSLRFTDRSAAVESAGPLQVGRGARNVFEILRARPVVFTYHTVDALQGSSRVRAKLWAVTELKFSVFAFLAFLDVTYQGFPYSRTPDARAYEDGDRGACQIEGEL